MPRLDLVKPCQPDGYGWTKRPTEVLEFSERYTNISINLITYPLYFGILEDNIEKHTFFSMSVLLRDTLFRENQGGVMTYFLL